MYVSLRLHSYQADICILLCTTGNRILNKCPKHNSCGTASPYWTDGVVPAYVGVSTNITAYMSYSSTGNDEDCKWYKGSNNIQLEVMRCSLTEHDVIYKYSGIIGYLNICFHAFCGMM